MQERLIFSQLASLPDLVRLVSVSPTPFLEHASMGGKDVYFIHAITLAGPPMVYYVELREKLTNKYIVFNRYKDEITFSDTLGSDPQSAYIPILEVKRTNIFPAYPPK
ncbi:MAG: hypothetical protein ACE5PO_07360 [Candidatus Bathyarchaeia archaeon]